MNADDTGRMPAGPRTFEAIGLPLELVSQLVAKLLHVSSGLTGIDLSSRLGVSLRLLEPALDLLKRQRLCEIAGGSPGQQSPQYRLTESGHLRAAGFMERNAYVGRLPVPLAQYTAYMKRFGRPTDLLVSRDAVRRVFSHLVLSDRVLEQLGTGISARQALFIYGPSGNGKTVIAHAIGALLGDHLAIPYALSVDSEIIQVYDALNHHPVDGADDELSHSVVRETTLDRRWIKCRRPVIGVGGELRIEALDLGYAANSGLYRAPLQVLANGGVLIIDDFGRQRPSPREMLNRWIVPLESRMDHLVLQTGQQFEVPFDALIVLATNLNPVELLDEAFLRRIKYKVCAESPSIEQFVRIFEQCCHQQGLRFDRTLVDALIANELTPRHVHLRGCHPRDLIELAILSAKHRDAPAELTADSLAEACATYFLAEDPNDR